MTNEDTNSSTATAGGDTLRLPLSDGLGAWVKTDEQLPPEGVELFATGWAYQDQKQGRYFSVVVYLGNDDWASPDDIERAEHDQYRPTHWMFPPAVSA